MDPKELRDGETRSRPWGMLLQLIVFGLIALILPLLGYFLLRRLLAWSA